jgi:hypothetical protein
MEVKPVVCPLCRRLAIIRGGRPFVAVCCGWSTCKNMRVVLATTKEGAVTLWNLEMR